MRGNEQFDPTERKTITISASFATLALLVSMLICVAVPRQSSKPVTAIEVTPTSQVPPAPSTPQKP